MLFVKIMDDNPHPDMDDSNPFKNFAIIPVGNNDVMKFVSNTVPFDQVGNNPGERYSLIIKRSTGEEESFFLTGNAYVMSESGKTIASHGC